MAYTLYTNGILEKDGFPIPQNDYNPDYIIYLQWLDAGNQPTIKPANEYPFTIDKQAVKETYQAMIERLDQIQNAGTIPFTQAGFNLMVQTVKDEALYIERLTKLIKILLT